MEGDLDRSHRVAFWNPELWLAITVKVNDLDLHVFFQCFYIALGLEIKIDK